MSRCPGGPAGGAGGIALSPRAVTSPADPASAAQPGLRDLFRHGDFVRLVCGRAMLTLGSLAQTVALGWLVYSISGNPLHLGLVGLAEFIPAFLLALPAGQLVDRMDRRLLLSMATLADAAAATLLLIFVLTGVDSVWPVFGVAVLTGSARAFAFPAAQALLPNTVPTALLPNAIALGSSTFQVAAIAGPAVGGLLYIIGPQAVFGTALGLFLATAVLTFRIRAQRGQQSQREPATWATVLAGLAFIRRRPIVLGAISLDLFAVLFGGATALLPIFAGEILHVGPLGLGLLRSAPAVGAALMAIYLSWRPMRDRVGVRLFAAVAVFGLATIVFGLSTTFWLSFAALLVLGAADEISVFVRLTLIQLATPDEMRGRVAAVNSVFIGASNQLGEFESGATAALMGVVPAVVFGGCGTLAVTLLWIRWFPALAHIRRFSDLNRMES